MCLKPIAFKVSIKPLNITAHYFRNIMFGEIKYSFGHIGGRHDTQSLELQYDAHVHFKESYTLKKQGSMKKL